MKEISIYGRNREVEELRQFVSRRRSFLIHGPVGVGKTLLLKYIAKDIPQMLYCAEPSSGQTVFRILAVEMLSRGNRHLRKICGTRGPAALKEKSAVSLRGVVADGLREACYWIVLDHLQSPSQSFANAVKDVSGLTETPIIAVARSAHMEDVGFLLPMFSERSAKFPLRNFDPDTAMNFANQAADAMNLRALNRDEVIQKIVNLGEGNPGAIVAMLQMAAGPKYVAQQHVKLSPLYIDFRLTWGTTHG